MKIEIDENKIKIEDEFLKKIISGTNDFKEEIKTLTSYRVLLYLISLGFNTEEVKKLPSKTKLAYELGVSRVSIHTSINELVEKRILIEKFEEEDFYFDDECKKELYELEEIIKSDIEYYKSSKEKYKILEKKIETLKNGGDNESKIKINLQIEEERNKLEELEYKIKFRKDMQFVITAERRLCEIYKDIVINKDCKKSINKGCYKINKFYNSGDFKSIINSIYKKMGLCYEIRLKPWKIDLKEKARKEYKNKNAEFLKYLMNSFVDLKNENY